MNIAPGQSMILNDGQQDPVEGPSIEHLPTALLHEEHMSLDPHSNMYMPLDEIPEDVLLNDTERIIHSLGAYNPHEVLGSELKDIVSALREHQARFEAVSLLSSLKERPLTRLEYSRLTNLLTFVFTTTKTGDKIAALKEAARTEVLTLIILGLCMTQTHLEQMRKELFGACFVEARSLAPLLSAALGTDAQVHQAIDASRANTEFKHAVWTMQQHANVATMKPPLTFSAFDKPIASHHYGVVANNAVPALRRLLSMSVSGHVATFVPEDPRMDCIVRIAIVWDRVILEQVFGWAEASVDIEEPLALVAAIRSQVPPAFGVEIWKAVQESVTYRGEAQDDLSTRAIRGKAFPQHSIIVDLRVARAWCDLFVSQAYRDN